jgi:hypothetical protein
LVKPTPLREEFETEHVLPLVPWMLIETMELEQTLPQKLPEQMMQELEDVEVADMV